MQNCISLCIHLYLFSSFYSITCSCNSLHTTTSSASASVLSVIVYEDNFLLLVHCMRELEKRAKILMKYFSLSISVVCVCLKLHERGGEMELQLIANRPSLIVLINLSYLSNNSKDFFIHSMVTLLIFDFNVFNLIAHFRGKMRSI